MKAKVFEVILHKLPGWGEHPIAQTQLRAQNNRVSNHIISGKKVNCQTISQP